MTPVYATDNDDHKRRTRSKAGETEEDSTSETRENDVVCLASSPGLTHLESGLHYPQKHLGICGRLCTNIGRGRPVSLGHGLIPLQTK